MDCPEPADRPETTDNGQHRHLEYSKIHRHVHFRNHHPHTNLRNSPLAAKTHLCIKTPGAPPHTLSVKQKSHGVPSVPPRVLRASLVNAPAITRKWPSWPSFRAYLCANSPELVHHDHEIPPRFSASNEAPWEQIPPIKCAQLRFSARAQKHNSIAMPSLSRLSRRPLDRRCPRRRPWE
jgi:hypothetical protein